MERAPRSQGTPHQRLRFAVARMRAEGVTIETIATLADTTPGGVKAMLDAHREYASRGLEPLLLPSGRMRGNHATMPSALTLAELRAALSEVHALREQRNAQAEQVRDRETERMEHGLLAWLDRYARSVTYDRDLVPPTIAELDAVTVRGAQR